MFILVMKELLQVLFSAFHFFLKRHFLYKTHDFVATSNILWTVLCNEMSNRLLKHKNICQFEN